MKPRTLLILLAVVLGLGAFVWFYERKLPSSEERAENAKKVVALKKEDVQAVTLESSSGRVELARATPPAAASDKKKDEKKDETPADLAGDAEGQPASAWKLVQPMAARADAFAVDGLLDAVLGLQKSRTLEKADRAATGLDKPRATVHLKTADGETVLRLGAEVPTGGELIAGIDGRSDAYVVSDTILTQLQREPGAWRDRQLFRASRDAITRLTLTGPPGGPVVLTQKDGAFRVESPLADRADREKVDDLYADLSGLTAEKFIDGPEANPAALGFQPPKAVVDVAFAKGEPLRIEIGGPAEEPAPQPGQPPEPSTQPTVYARIGQQVFTARTRLAATALASPADWRAKGLSAFEVFQVESATVKDAKGNFRLTRAGTDWKRDGTTISYLPVSDFLFALTGAKADRLLTPTEAQGLGAGVGQPALTVDLASKDAGSETVTLYPAVAAGTPARVSGRDVVLLLPGDKLGEIQGKLNDVRNAKPEEGAPAKK